MVHVNLIEEHSDICNKVEEGIKKLDESNHEFNIVNFKLKKLQDHLLTLLEENNNENKKETYMMEIMNQTLKDALLIAKIDSSSVINLKKFLTNLEVSINILFILFI